MGKTTGIAGALAACEAPRARPARRPCPPDCGVDGAALGRGSAIQTGPELDADSIAIRALNGESLNDGRAELCLVPICDGLTMARKKDAGGFI
ncbi:hypothetical protein [Aestuariivirga sp.]|uniref:hypothetical protein n=1 Tax=Aestuariivirga sp. TaxID=2650926 RepID=UPI0025BAFE1D|nr:hypothetical protein [Aestuariivirga sp.]MCA3555559.1 hypothetical protein [Aestuariivirga sp.]